MRYFANLLKPDDDEVTPTSHVAARKPIANIDEAILSLHFDIENLRGVVNDLKPYLIAVRWVPLMIAGLLLSAFFSNVIQAIALLKR